MNNKTIKMLMISIIMMIGMFFACTGDVSAAKNKCTCYYYGDLQKNYNVIQNSNGMYYSSYDGYLLKIRLNANKNNFEIQYFCETGEMAYSPSSDTQMPKQKCESLTQKASIIHGDKDHSNLDNSIKQEILQNDCSVSACEKANLYFYSYAGSKNISINGVPSDFATTTKLNAIPYNPGFKDLYNSSDFYTTAYQGSFTTFKPDVVNPTTGQSVQNNNLNITQEQILSYANKYSNLKEYSTSGYCEIIDGKVIEYINNLFFVIQIIGIILLVILSMVEFIKAVTAGSDDGIKGALKNTFIRIIAAVLLLLTPMLVTWILNIINENQYVKGENGSYVIGSDGNPLCK
ncbi:MAG: hypothetical protein IJ093_02935 [Bacilli bacterium]|nr:hypothetical protein [Bacilli bacterium]